jgi:hypothetical protein
LPSEKGLILLGLLELHFANLGEKKYALTMTATTVKCVYLKLTQPRLKA